MRGVPLGPLMTLFKLLRRLWNFVTRKRVGPKFQSAFQRRATRLGIYRLSPHEQWWKEHYAVLKESGYRLRPRFRPRWKPSWLGKDTTVAAEDGIELKNENVVDARQRDDGKVIAIKRIEHGSSEGDIGRMLSPSNESREATNHCVPILNYFQDPLNPEVDYIIMPLLRKFDNPEFYAVNEVVELVRQVIEGLEFMHSRGVAHGDCSGPNIMMDGKPLYPRGFHPSAQDKDAFGIKPAKYLHRSDVRSIDYFFVDYSHSCCFGKNPTEVPVAGTGLQGGSSDLEGRRDAFSVDIFSLGWTLKESFINKYRNLEVLLPLVESMTQVDAASRPTAATALEQIQEIAARYGEPFSQRLVKNDETFVSAVLDGCVFELYRVTRSSREVLRKWF
ncbi:hypothetical protein M0805_005515 [Coniferiporia weirii]|nr:hypothetical protein M0805_005515 [Coniferiporia weirii]